MDVVVDLRENQSEDKAERIHVTFITVLLFVIKLILP
jgi:hypothetical protein